LSWTARQAAYAEVASKLYILAAQRALAAADVDPSTIAAVVTISSTGIATPSLEARAASALRLSPTAQRIPIFGLGCAGGVSGLRIAADLARAHLGKPILLVAVELCTLSFRSDAATKSNIVATALFGDGAAACVLRASHKSPPGSISITNSREHLYPETLDLMGWEVDDSGLGVIFARSIPDFARQNMADSINNLLEEADLNYSDVGRFVCHPGGTKVLQAIEGALELKPGALATERQVLSAFGNMSAPTVLFVLKAAMSEGLPDRTIMVAMGPGFTISTALLERKA
jgi:alkylresorcinol/alkylpyrone synthase